MHLLYFVEVSEDYLVLSGGEGEGRPGWGTSRVGTALGPLDSECMMFVNKFLVLKTVRRPLADINPECIHRFPSLD